LGCDVDIQKLKSKIVDFQQKLKSTIVMEVVSILSATLEKQYLRKKYLDNEIKKIKGQLVEVQSQLKEEKEELEKNKHDNAEKYKKNAKMLKKQAKDKHILQETLQNCAKKIKDLEKKLQHVLVAAPEQSEDSTTTKRGSKNFSSSQEQGFQKPPMQQARVVTN
jgi:predicted nuclease with TOPRIM domain